MTRSHPMDARLPFPTKPLIINGIEVEEYIIPEDRKAEVLNALYLFCPVPSLDEERLDLHSDKIFKVREQSQNPRKHILLRHLKAATYYTDIFRTKNCVKSVQSVAPLAGSGRHPNGVIGR